MNTFEFKYLPGETVAQGTIYSIVIRKSGVTYYIDKKHYKEDELYKRSEPVTKDLLDLYIKGGYSAQYILGMIKLRGVE